MESNNGRQHAAKDHLALLKLSHERQDRDDHYYVGLASTYGLSVDEITTHSGLTTDRVRHLLAGA